MRVIRNLVVKVKERHSIYLLASLLLFMFVGPLIQQPRFMKLFYDFVLAVVAVSGFFLIPEERRSLLFKVLFGFVLLSTVFDVLDFFGEANIVSHAIWSIFLLNVLYQIFLLTIQKDYSAASAMINSIAGYLVMGIIGAAVIDIAQFFEMNPMKEELKYFDLIYFSFVTMTTLGYGDITPYTVEGKTIAIAITICGQLYIAVVIAINLAKYMSLVNSEPTDHKLEQINNKLDELMRKMEEEDQK